MEGVVDLRIIARKRWKGSVAATDPSTFPHGLWFEHRRGGDSVDEKSYHSTMDPTKLARAAVRIDVRSPLSYLPTFAMLSTNVSAFVGVMAGTC
jgi:hypothetical protein